MISKQVHLIAAARPNFMKVAPLFHALHAQPWCEPVIVHTGQHYDFNMSDAFFRDLGLPEPDINLEIGSGSHAEQTAGVMIAYERLLAENPPDMTVVVGDVNSTLACTLAAKKLNRPVAHLEAGLRSNDRTMPEEINRILTDAIADVLWTPSRDGDENLLREGVPAERILRVGNIMIDSFELLRPRIEAENSHAAFGLTPGNYGVVTLHRPSNVDDPETLALLVDGLAQVAKKVPLIFAMHPRTRKSLEGLGLMDRLRTAAGIHLTEPLSYIRFMGLVVGSRFAVTDSGGLQEETTYLGIPCVTLRTTTERPITITNGTNRLATAQDLPAMVEAILAGHWAEGACPELWDGQAAGRVAQDLKARLA